MAIDHQPPSDQPAPWDGRPPGYPAPGYPASGYSASGYSAPGYSAPGYSAPGYTAPGYPAPGYPTAGYPAASYPGPGYSAPGYVVPSSGLAVASLVCSLVGLLTAGLGAIAGVICGHLALSETRTGARSGHGMAVAGLIIGWIQCGLWILFWVVVLIGGLASV